MSNVRIAAIDIGSNSIHLVVVSVSESGRIELLDREKEMVKLGAPVFQTGSIDRETFTKAVATMRRYVRIADGREALDIQAVATSAVREAKNGLALLAAMGRETGVAPRLISGAEEARLIWLAVQHALTPELPALVVDIGGGSVELSWGTAQSFSHGVSLKLGVQRMAHDFGSDELSSKARKALAKRVRQALPPGISISARTLVGTSGTIRELAEICLKRRGAPDDGKIVCIQRDELVALADDLCGMTADERAELADERRADTLHVGAAVLEEIVCATDAEQIVVSDATLRDGVVLDYLRQHHAWQMPALPGGARQRAVVGLARRYGRASPADWHVRRLAEELFDATHRSLELDARSRELLGHAALLHAIGKRVRYKGHHKHGRYLIKNGELYGFTGEEVRALSLIVRYHRKKLPKRKHKRLRKLARPQRKTIEKLAALLRLAVALDRGATQAVKDAELTRGEDGNLMLQLRGSSPQLEAWAARRGKKALEKVLKSGIQIAGGND